LVHFKEVKMQYFQDTNTEIFDDLINDDNTLKTVSYKEIIDRCKSLGNRDLLLPLSIWMNKKGYYVYPTKELLSFVEERIDGRYAVEIGAGMTGFGKHLGILSTDSYMQSRADVKEYYEMLGQKITEPQHFVEKMDGNEVVDKKKPDVIIGCYITHKYRPGMESGSEFGVVEEHIISNCDYINIGNLVVHASKPLFQYEHEVIHSPFVLTRSTKWNDNRIFIWKKQCIS